MILASTIISCDGKGFAVETHPEEVVLTSKGISQASRLGFSE